MKRDNLKEMCQTIKRNAFEVGTTVLFLGWLVKLIRHELGF